jgi:hypothetical protein
MGCCCSKSTEVKEPLQNPKPNQSDPSQNILDSPFSKSLPRNQDGTVITENLPKAVLDAYQDALDDDDYFDDLNKTFKANPINQFPFLEPWKETTVPESEFLLNERLYEPPVLQDPQADYLIDMQAGGLTVFSLTSHSETCFQGKLYSSTGRAVYLFPSKVLICGGRGSKGTFLLDIESGSLQKQGNLQEAREYHSLSVIDDFVVASGGSGYEDLASCEVFYRGKWSRTGDLNCPRSFHSTVTVDKCVYAVGGKVKSIEKWNGGIWTLLSLQLPGPCLRAGICPLTRNSFLVVGGESQGLYLNSAWEVDFVKGTVKDVSSLGKIAVFDNSGSLSEGMAYFLIAGEVVVFNTRSRVWNNY